VLDRLDRARLEPRRLASGAVFGVLIGVVSLFFLGSEGHQVVPYAGIALAIALIAPWIVAVMIRRRPRGK
jgi:ABC-type Co2+ transport system permease subunit